MNYFYVTVWQAHRAEPLLERLGAVLSKRWHEGATVFVLRTTASTQHVRDVLWAGCIERSTVQPVPKHVVDEYHERSV